MSSPKPYKLNFDHSNTLIELLKKHLKGERKNANSDKSLNFLFLINYEKMHQRDLSIVYIKLKKILRCMLKPIKEQSII